MLRFLKPHLLTCSLYCWKTLDEVHLSSFQNVLAYTLYTIELGDQTLSKFMGGVGGLVLEVLKAEGPGSVFLEDFFYLEPKW